MSRVAIFGIWFVFIVSVSALLFFILAVNPKYLNLSGFLFFYAGIFGFFWSVILLLWGYLKRGRARDAGGALRQAAFLSLCVAVILFFSQMRVLSWYTIVPFGALFLFTQYVLIRRG